MWGFYLLPRLHVPFTYLWSESLIPKPWDWGSHINITGFSFLPLADSYTPPADLVEFLDEGPPPIYIGFGSIVIGEPTTLKRLIFTAVKKAGVRAIISKGWSGIGDEDDAPTGIYLIGNCPHDWLFQQVSAVVHHGGAGTTAAGIAAGRPTVVIPFFGDQPFWGRMVAQSGAGPPPVPFNEMTADSLAASISLALKPGLVDRAREMAKDIAQGNGAENTARRFQRLVADDQFQCDICPGRLATWRHTKTGARLSGFAICCLIHRGVIQYRDLKLLHHKNWYVDEGAEHPFVGVAASLTGFISTVTTATSDYSRALKNWRGAPVAAERTNEQAHSPMIASNEETENITRFIQNLDTHDLDTHDVLFKSLISANAITLREIDMIFMLMARKSSHSLSPATNARRKLAFHDQERVILKSQERGSHGGGYYIARTTGRYAAKITKAGLKAPVALFWNTANGFHNFPSYAYSSVEARRRDQITSLGTGLKSAGKECILGVWHAFSGIVTQPYKATNEEGIKGIGKGIWRGGHGFICNLGAGECSFATFPPYCSDKAWSRHGRPQMLMAA